jgi:hypothetical protein
MGFVPALLLMILIFTLSSGLSHLIAVADSPDWTAYYPLAVGNTWIYKQHVADDRKSGTVRWEVTQTLEENGKRIYLVVPHPIQEDDDYLELSLGPGGVEEVRQGIFHLKFPVIAGQQWSKEYQSVLKNREVSRKFSVMSVGQPCKVGKLAFSDCVVIEDSDEELELKTVTTYARNVGPVSYEYFKCPSGSTVDKFFESLELLSHDLKPSK